MSFLKLRRNCIPKNILVQTRGLGKEKLIKGIALTATLTHIAAKHPQIGC